MTAFLTDSARLARLIRFAAWGGAAFLFLLPLVAMQFSAEVDWSPFDFMIWGAMLLVALGAVEVALRASGSLAYRLAALAGIGAGFLLVWINLAVGIIGSEDFAANLLYAGVLAIGVVGAIVARFRASGLWVVLAVMAVAQLAVGVLALVMSWDGRILLDGAFALVWLLASGLFRWAARDEEAR